MLIEGVQTATLPVRKPMASAAFWLTFGAATAVVFSIAISQTLMGFALAALLLSGETLRFPPVKLPFALYSAATLVSLWLSPDPHSGIPQLRKFYVFAILLLVPSTFRTAEHVRNLVFAWGAAGVLSAVRGFSQFVDRRAEALAQNANTYGFYLDARITGFASHWMTFGGELMLIALMLGAWLLFSPRAKWKAGGWVCVAVLYTALVLGLTRSIFLLGAPAGFAFLLWKWKPWSLAAVALLAIAGVLAAPFQVRERVKSVVTPHGDVDSNAFRAVTRRTGWAMVKAHPWFGLGPEQVKSQFDAYVPADAARPLPRGWYGHLHNLYLQIAAERGVPALLFLLWFIGAALYRFSAVLRGVPRCDARAAVLYGAIAAALAILAEGMFEYNLGDSEVLTVFLAVLGCGYVVSEAHGP